MAIKVPRGDHWLTNCEFDLVPAGAVFSARAERSTPEDPHLTPSQQYGVITQQQYMEITGNRVVLNLTGADNMKHVEPGDYIIHLRSFQGGIELSRIAGKVSNAYTVLTPRTELNEDYFRYLLKCDSFIDGLASMTDQLRDGQNISYAKFSQLKLPLPDLATQRAIADYLDRETRQIDAMAAKLDGLTERLEERRAAVIPTATTGQLRSRPEQDWATNKWLGKFPAEWNEQRIGALVVRSKVPNTGMLESNLLSLSYGRIKRKDINTDEGLLPASFETYQIVDPGCEVFRFTDLQNDQKSLRSGLVTERGIITSAYVATSPRLTHIVPRYFDYSMRSLDLAKAFYQMGAGVRQTVKFEDLAQVKIPLPSMDEQRRIADYLDKQTAKIDAMIVKAAQLKELLAERRSALITATVIGNNDAYKEA